MDSKITASEQHKAIMSVLGMAEDVIRFVSSIEDPIVCEWIYLCALDGMPLEHLKKLYRIPDQNTVRKANHIWAERKKYLQSVFKNPDSVASRSLETMLHQVKAMYEESRGLRELVDESIRRSQKEQGKAAKISEAAQEVLLREKQSIIEKQERYIHQLEKNVRDSEKELPKTGKFSFRGILAPAKMGRRILELKKKKHSQKFIDTYLKDNTYSEEQKEYLLKCFEEGATLKDMEKFASPDLSVSLMERLKKANA